MGEHMRPIRTFLIIAAAVMLLLPIMPSQAFSATYFELSGSPSNITAGSPFNITVTAKNANSTTDTGYAGTIYFSSSAASATLPGPYTFVTADNGYHTFSITLNTAGSQTIKVSDSGLEGYWKLDEGVGTTTADASGNGNTATLYGPAWSSDVPYPSNPASLSFNGTTGYVSIPKPQALQLTTSTTTAWVKADTNVTVHRILFSDETSGGGSNSAGYACFLLSTSGILRCDIKHGATTSLFSETALNDNTWHHVALAINNGTGTATIYVDGAAKATTTGVTLSPSPNPLILGQLDSLQYSNPFLGLLDDLRIYNRALTSAEIATLATGGEAPSVLRGSSPTITVTTPATITVQPQSTNNIIGGETSTLNVTAIGDGILSYQWYKGISPDTSVPISAAITNSYTTPPIYGPASYWVQVTGTYGAPANSNTAQIITHFSNGPSENITGITIVDNAAASPYPSSIVVSGVSETVERVRVTLKGINHTWPSDIGVLLVGPGGQNVVLMDLTGGREPITGVNLTFDDTGSPLTTGKISSGTYQPTNLDPSRTFPLPAPVGLYAANLAVFNGINPNGTWNLYVRDAGDGDFGSISGGWEIEFLTRTYSLKINVDGTGHGFVTYTQKPFVVNTSYETSVISGKVVTLEPSPDEYSIAGWSGVSGCSSGTCQFTMNSNTTATAAFNIDSAHSVLVDTDYHATIAEAYGAGTTTNGETIKLWSITYTENPLPLLFNLSKTVILSGGYNGSFTLQNPGEVATITGPLKIKAGTVIVDKITVK
jgi:subtilisin-like proprotein convertase family protein